MSLEKSEKIFLVILSVLLFAGAMILHFRQSRPRPKIVIVKKGVKEELSLKEVEARLKESRKVNINTATIEDFTSIPGIGEILAARIVEYRNRHGSFESASYLLEVEGISEGKFEKIKEYIKIE